MNKDARDLFENYTKTCFVVLQRLDENLLNQYSKKYGLKITSLNLSKNSEIKRVHCSDNQKLRKHVNGNEKRKKQDVKESLKETEFKIKKKAKPLCYSDDDEDCTSHKSYEETLLKEKKGVNDKESCASPDTIGDRVFLNKALKFEEINELMEKGISCTDSENAKISLPKQEENDTVSKVEDVKNTLNDSYYRENGNVPVSVMKSETVNHHEEINQEVYTKNSLECDQTKVQVVPISECFAEKTEEIECDSREDSVDDRNTVFFEELHDNEVYKETGNREIERAMIDKKRDLKTRKKEMLIDFKRKDLRRIKKPKSDFAEKCSSEKAVKKTQIDKVSEDSLEEVCGLVKRLHELYKIILQLQKELPKNDELAFHFSKVINAQKENFRKEIRKSQKIIIQCYEKMLILYNDFNKVTLEISRRASLGAEDVINVISCCLLLEGACDVEKGEKSEVFLSQNAAENSDTNLKVINENSVRPNAKVAVQETDHMETTHPHFPSRNDTRHPESVQRPINEHVVTFQPTTKGPNHMFNGFLMPSSNGLKQRVEYEENKSNTGQNHTEKIQMAGDPRTVHIAHGSRRRNSQIVKRYLPQTHNIQPPHIRAQNCPIKSIPQSERPTFYGYPVSSSFDFCHQGNISSVREKENPKLSFPERSNIYFSNYVQEGLSINQFYQRSQKTQTVNNTIPVPAVESTECVSVPDYSAPLHFSNLSRCVYQSETYNRPIISQNLTPICSENQLKLKNILTDCVRSSRQIGLYDERRVLSIDETSKNFCTEIQPTSGSGNSSSEILQNVLDPTIPQKLTMRNYRLQAGPVLDLGTNGEISESADKLRSFAREENNFIELKNPHVENSKSRVYVCAQNGCKNPGVRICRGCKSIIYCSDTCQLKHWTLKHKAECYQLKKLRE